MRNLNRLVVILFTLVLIAGSSCKKKDDVISSGGKCFASWEVDNVKYDQEDMAGCIFIDSVLHLSSSITGGDFIMQIEPIIAPGTYVADSNNPDLDVIILLKLTDGKQIGIKNGSVVVTDFNSSKIKGTFSGNFFDLQGVSQDPIFSVTKGKFEAKF